MRTHKIIPVVDARRALVAPAVAEHHTGHLVDTLGRPLHDLRISVTDRCNFRCSYCMPKEVFDHRHVFLPQTALLSFEEITRMARIFVSLGVKKIRLTGGEPLLRKHIEALIEQLSALRTPQGELLDLTLTTNASLLARKARALKQAGLRRITVSLDALDDATFRRMNDVDFPVHAVLEGLEQAHRVGFEAIKVNMVVKRGTNDHEILPMARHFRHTSTVLRFIEYMDVGSTNGWCRDEMLPSSQVIAQINEVFALKPLSPAQPGETAVRWGYQDGGGEIGVISSVTQAFCHDCHRARLSTQGQLFLCLFANQGHDLRPALRGGASDEEMAQTVRAIWSQRSDRYSLVRGSADAPKGEPRVEMHYIGG